MAIYLRFSCTCATDLPGASAAKKTIGKRVPEISTESHVHAIRKSAAYSDFTGIAAILIHLQFVVTVFYLTPITFVLLHNDTVASHTRLSFPLCPSAFEYPVQASTPLTDLRTFLALWIAHDRQLASTS